MKVLVVDDSAGVRARLVAMLGEVVGVDEVVEADASGAALTTARAAQPSVIVLDLNLGAESGLALLPLLRSEHVGAVVIVLTNHTSDAHRRQCEASGANFFFDKSSEFDRVVEIVAVMNARGTSLC